MKTFNPYILKNTSIPIIVYPFENVEIDKRTLNQEIQIGYQDLLLPRDPIYAIALPWRKNEKSFCIDFHVYNGEYNNWEEFNPSIRDFQTTNGTEITSGDNSCERGIIIRGKEGSFRVKRTSSLQDYINRRPNQDSSYSNLKNLE
ncbi:MAG: hypothetical protein ACI83O_000499 [Patescibacteria group bacterium]|jgi:hypothetical protein